MTVCLKAGLETSAWTFLNHLAIWGSIICWFLFLAIYPEVWPKIDIGPAMVGMVSLAKMTFWFIGIGTIYIAIVEQICVRVLTFLDGSDFDSCHLPCSRFCVESVSVLESSYSYRNYRNALILERYIIAQFQILF